MDVIWNYGWEKWGTRCRFASRVWKGEANYVVKGYLESCYRNEAQKMAKAELLRAFEMALSEPPAADY